MNFKDFLAKLQNLPDNQKKIILWAIVGVLALTMGIFWIRGALNSINKIGESVSQIKLPEVQTPDEEAPSFEALTDPTADWKTYKNTDYGFEIKYPNGWSVEEDLPNKNFLVKFSEIDNYPVLNIRFLSEDYSKVLAQEEKRLAEWSKDSPEGLNSGEKDITFSEVPAKEFYYFSPIGATEQLILVKKDNLTLQVKSFSNSVLDPILSTFKFIEK